MLGSAASPDRRVRRRPAFDKVLGRIHVATAAQASQVHEANDKHDNAKRSHGRIPTIESISLLHAETFLQRPKLALE